MGVYNEDPAHTAVANLAQNSQYPTQPHWLMDVGTIFCRDVATFMVWYMFGRVQKASMGVKVSS